MSVTGCTLFSFDIAEQQIPYTAFLVSLAPEL